MSNNSLDHTSILHDAPLPSVHVNGPRTSLSTDITINEPHWDWSTMETHNQRSQVSMDVLGKRKRKVDDIPMFTENGSYAINGSFPECVSPARHILEPLSFCSNRNAGRSREL